MFFVPMKFFEYYRHSNKDYIFWMSRFLTRVQSPIYVLTSPYWAPLLRELRGDLPMLINDSYPEIFDVPIVQEYSHTFDDVGFIPELDPREQPLRHHYSRLVSAVWFTKTWWTREVARENPWNTEYFAWVDIGAWKELPGYFEWPDNDRVAALVGERKSDPEEETLISVSVERELREDRVMKYNIEQGPRYPVAGVAANFFLGRRGAIEWFHSEFIRLREYFRKKGFNVQREEWIFEPVNMVNFHRVKCLNGLSGSKCTKSLWFKWLDVFLSDKEAHYVCPDLVRATTKTGYQENRVHANPDFYPFAYPILAR